MKEQKYDKYQSYFGDKKVQLFNRYIVNFVSSVNTIYIF